jgi:hypothetical protein
LLLTLAVQVQLNPKSIYPVPSSQRVVARGGRRGGETRRGNRGGAGRAPSGVIGLVT